MLRIDANDGDKFFKLYFPSVSVLRCICVVYTYWFCVDVKMKIKKINNTRVANTSIKEEIVKQKPITFAI